MSDHAKTRTIYALAPLEPSQDCSLSKVYLREDENGNFTPSFPLVSDDSESAGVMKLGDDSTLCIYANNYEEKDAAFELIWAAWSAQCAAVNTSFVFLRLATDADGNVTEPVQVATAEGLWCMGPSVAGSDSVRASSFGYTLGKLAEGMKRELDAGNMDSRQAANTSRARNRTRTNLSKQQRSHLRDNTVNCVLYKYDAEGEVEVIDVHK